MLNVYDCTTVYVKAPWTSKCISMYIQILSKRLRLLLEQHTLTVVNFKQVSPNLFSKAAQVFKMFKARFTILWPSLLSFAPFTAPLGKASLFKLWLWWLFTFNDFNVDLKTFATFAIWTFERFATWSIMRPCHYGAMWSYCKALALVRFSSSTFGSCAPWVADSLEFGAFTGNRENTSKGWPPELETFLPVTKYTVHWSHLDPSTDHHIRRLRAFKHKQVDSGLLSLLIERKNQVYQVGACKIISDMVKETILLRVFEKTFPLALVVVVTVRSGGRRARLWSGFADPCSRKQASLFTKKWSSQAGVCKQGHYSKRTGTEQIDGCLLMRSADALCSRTGGQMAQNETGKAEPVTPAKEHRAYI